MSYHPTGQVTSGLIGTALPGASASVLQTPGGLTLWQTESLKYKLGQPAPKAAAKKTSWWDRFWGGFGTAAGMQYGGQLYPGAYPGGVPPYDPSMYGPRIPWGTIALVGGGVALVVLLTRKRS